MFFDNTKQNLIIAVYFIKFKSDGLENDLSKRNFNPLHNFMKKYFNVEHPDAFKADVVNCVSETLCTAKIGIVRWFSFCLFYN